MDGDRNISASSPPWTQKKIITTTGILTSSPLPSRSLPLPTLPFDIVEEILCRLPVKFLMQLRCVCKSWKSLISDTKFSRKHLRVSTTRHHLILSSLTSPPRELTVMDYPISSVLTTVTTAAATQLQYPLNNHNRLDFPVGSCDGILCFFIDNNSALLWNPTIRKFNKLPDIGNGSREGQTIYGFGYDNLTNQYKVVAAFCYECYIDTDSDVDWVYKSQVKVHTVGTNCWRMIHKEFPYGYPLDLSGKFVNGTINWMASKESIDSIRPYVIVSFDLGNESYGEVLQPDYGAIDLVDLTISVLRDCLCILSHSDTFSDIWVMKEYGNKESWTKLFSISRNLGIDPYTMVYYVSEDDQVLLQLLSQELIVYNSKDGTIKTLEIQNINGAINGAMTPEIYIESLISPCS